MPKCESPIRAYVRKVHHVRSATETNDRLVEKITISVFPLSNKQEGAKNSLSPKQPKNVTQRIIHQINETNRIFSSKCNCLSIIKSADTDLVCMSYLRSCDSPTCINKIKKHNKPKMGTKLDCMHRKTVNLKKIYEVSSPSPIMAVTPNYLDFSKTNSDMKTLSSKLRLPYIRAKPLYRFSENTRITREYHQLLIN